MSLPDIPWWAASLVATGSIFRIEMVNRLSKAETFLEQMGLIWWLVLIAQWGLFRAWQGAPSMMTAWAWFFVVNVSLRIISVHYFVGEPMNLKVWVGIALIMGGALLVKTAAT